MKKIALLGALISAPAALYVASLYSACMGEHPFQRSRDIPGPVGQCKYQRGDNRCNGDSDCCPGKRCNAATGQCEWCN